MSVRCVCPFCNAWTVTVTPSPRTTCTRCGEVFEPGEWETTADATSIPSSAAPAPFPFRILMIMSLLALVAIGVALAVYRPWEKPAPAIVKVNGDQPVIPPLALQGLKFIPESANVVIALQPAMLDRDGRNANELLATLGVPASFAATLEKAGIATKEIEQLIAGVTFAPDRLIPGVTIVLRLYHPANDDRLLDALHAERKPTGGRPVYTTRLFSLLMTKADSRTFLFGFTEDDFAASKSQLPLAMRDALTNSVSPASWFWIVTDRRDWSTAHPFLRAEGGKKLTARLARGRGFTAGYSFEEPGSELRLTLDLADATTAKDVETIIREKLPDAAMVTVASQLTIMLRDKPEEILPKLAPIVREFLN